MALPEINIVSLNVAGLLNPVKCNRIANFLKQHRVDSVCLQETHLRPSEVNLLLFAFKGDIMHPLKVDLLA